MTGRERTDWAELIQSAYRRCGVRPRFDKVALWNVHTFLSAFDPTLYEEFRELKTMDQVDIYNELRETSAFLPEFNEAHR